MYKLFLPLAVAIAVLAPATGVAQQKLSRPEPQSAGNEARSALAKKEPTSERSIGPLRVSKDNPRYFTDAAGREVLLVGSHTWGNFIDAGAGDPPPPFDFDEYLGFLVHHGHNFFRLWAAEQTRWVIVSQSDNHFFFPNAYARTGPGLALDGKPRFDLTKLNEEYFRRLKQRVDAASEHGIYVAVMLFNGWSISATKGNFRARNVWRGHPFNRDNNINSVDGDPNGDDSGEEIHTLSVPGVTQAQALYVKEVVRTLADSDNVLYEISNESNIDSVEWQYFMIDLINEEQKRLGVQHPVGMTALFPAGTDQPLFDSKADWVSVGGVMEAPTPADGSKVLIADTDHICGICGTRSWAWKSFLSGENPVFMDPYDGALCGSACDGTQMNDPRWMDVRISLGHIRALSIRLHLDKLIPSPELSSTGYCLATAGNQATQLVTYIEGSGTVTLDLERFDGRPLTVEWINPSTGKTWSSEPVDGGSRQTLAAPFTGDAVLFVHDAD